MANQVRRRLLRRSLPLVALLLAACSTTAPTATLVHRDPAQVRAFRKDHPCPATGKTEGACKGFVVDHIIPLSLYGLDDPSNMQWQTVTDGHQKDELEWAAYHRRLQAEKALCPTR